MITRILIFCFLVMISFFGFAQRSYSISLFNNATQLPMASFSAVWKQPIHPGITAGYEFHWKENSPWFQTVKVGFYYHQFVQSAIQVYTDFGYRKTFKKGFFIDASICAGYLHAIPLTEQAQLNQKGNYEIKNGAGRAQIMFGLTPGLGYEFLNTNRKVSVFMNYQIWIQSPFVPTYVPLLPNGSVHIGARMAIHKKPTK
jgi:hypothetical protein